MNRQLRSFLTGLTGFAARAPQVVLATALALTALVVYYSYHMTEMELDAHFDTHVREVRNSILFHMHTYVQTLLQARGLFAADPHVTQEEFHDYIAEDLLEQFPGIQGVGFAERVPAAQLREHVADMRGHLPDYRVWPPGPRAEYYSIVYLEPFDSRNRHALGYDMSSDPARWAAMREARDTGRPAVTGKVALMQETAQHRQPGFLIYVPVYRRDAPTATIDDRRRALIGFVYSPFRADNLFRTTIGRELDRQLPLSFAVYDGARPNKRSLLFALEPNRDRGFAAITPSRTLPLLIAGHPWTLVVRAPLGIASLLAYMPALLLLIVGVAFSFMLYWLIRQVEQRRRAAEGARTRITRVLESIKDAFFSVDPSWRFTYVNQEAARFLRRSPSTLLGLNLWRTYPDLIGTAFQRACFRAAAERQGIQFEEYYLPLRTWFDVRIYPSGPDLSVYFQDINARKRNEEAVRVAQERFRSAFANASVGMAMTDREGRFIEVNAALCAMTGYSTESLVSHSFADITYEDDVAESLHLLDRLCAGEHESAEITTRYVRADGGIVWVQNSVSVVRGDDGQILHLISISQDITERKQAEDAFAAERERLAVTLYSITDGVITVDMKGRVVLINKTAERLTGWNQAQAVGRPLHDVFCMIDESQRQPLPDPTAQVLDSGEPLGGGRPAVLTALDGSERLVATSAAPIRNGDGDIVGAVLVCRDVTAQRKMEDELIKARNLESIGILAGGIAHDFNNILTAILGNITLAKMYYPGRDKVFDILTEAERAFDPARGLTQQLLTFAKGGAPIKKTGSIAQLVMDTATFALRGSNVRHRFDIPPDLWPIEFDSGQMNQVISNLVINAKQAMPDGGTVTIRGENATLPAGRVVGLAPGRYVRLTIADTGVGIASKHLDRIFDPYFTTKQQGSGLGLAITYSIIKKHDGHVEVASRIGIGTSFTIYLPVAASALARPATAVRALARGQGRVLVLDDEATVRNVAGRLLERLGYEVALSAKGEETVARYREALEAGRRFDAVLLDLTVPGGMGGKECMEVLRTIDPGVRAIVSSGYSTDPVMAQYAQYGFAGVVAKPYQVHELSETLWRVINENAPRRREMS